MKGLIWFIGLFALAVGLVMFSSLNQGYVQFVIPPWYRVYITLNLFFVLLLLGFVLCYALLRLIRHAMNLPSAAGQWRKRWRQQRADKALLDALRTLYEGRYAQSLKFAEKAFTNSEHPACATLLAARAAHALADETRYRIWIGRAVEQGEEIRVARLMTEAELAITSHHFDEAFERLETLRLSGQRHIAMLRLSLKAASALHQWEEVLRLARQLRKHKALTNEQALPLLRRAHIERLREHAGEGETLAHLWREIPPAELADRYLVEQIVPLLAATGQGALARRTLERLLDDEWDSGLARIYAYCGTDEKDATVCLSKGENWLRQHPHDAGLLFALGRLCMSTQLWGKAQSYLEASLGLAPASETHLILARLFEHLGRPDDAQPHYRAVAEKITSEIR
ncbi:MAG: heme biosynthesis protein HemY [Azoarcus sp.]|jgi:HemY protein|nr:heme biosynthesis protein HemY [Azoarcus sp.]